MGSPLLAQAALLLHVPLCIALLASLKPARAVAYCLLSAILFLPEKVGFDFPLVPPLTKESLPLLVVWVGLLIKGTPEVGRRSAFPVVVGSILVMGTLGTFLTNRDAIAVAPVRVIQGLGVSDLITDLSRDVLSFLLPFAIARRVFRSRQAIGDLLEVVTILGIVYAFLMLIEIRLSPQLNSWVYGFHQHSFRQTIRGGGYRPMVFMAHGLATVMFCLVTVLAATTLQRVKSRVLSLQPVWFASFFALVLVFSHSLGVLVYAVVAIPLLLLAGPPLVVTFARVIAGLVLFIPLLRATGLLPIDQMLAFFATIDVERAASLEFRFDNETALLDKWSLRPLFGWGGWGRARLFDEQGHDMTVTDGEWIIALSHRGLVGFVGEFLLMLGPVWMAARRLKFASAPERVLLAGLALIVTLQALDMVPNGRFNYLPLFFAGALFGFVEQLAAQPRLPREAAT